MTNRLHEYRHAALSALRKQCFLTSFQRNGFTTAQLLQTCHHFCTRISGADAPAVTPTHLTSSPTLPGYLSHHQSKTRFCPSLGQLRQTVGVRGVFRTDHQTTSACSARARTASCRLVVAYRCHLCADRQFSGSVYAARRYIRRVIHRQRGLGHKGEFLFFLTVSFHTSSGDSTRYIPPSGCCTDPSCLPLPGARRDR